MTSKATATVKGGFWEINAVPSLVSSSGRSWGRYQAAKVLAKKGLMALRATMRALDGVAPGAAATKTLARIENNAELGGKRVIETETLINRVTVAGDVTEINADVLSLSTRTTFGASPKPNLDQNPLGTR
jgi:hypothetical protein